MLKVSIMKNVISKDCLKKRFTEFQKFCVKLNSFELKNLKYFAKYIFSSLNSY